MAKQITAPLEVWVVDGEQRFLGAAPPPALAAAISALAQRVAASGVPQSADVLLTAGEDGARGSIRLAARPEADGRVAVASLALDDLHEAQDALSRYEMVMDATRDAVWDWNVATQQAWWNRQQYEMLGYDPESIVPSYEAWANRIYPEDRERVVQHFQEVVASGATIWQDEFRFIRGEGSVGVALDRGYIARDPNGQPLRMIGVMSDLTAERAATAALRESEERFRQMTSAIDQVFWVTNRDQTVLEYISPAYETVWGRSRESLYREPASFLDAIHEDDRAHIKALMPSQRERSTDEVYRITRPDGTVAWIRDRAFPIRNAAGEVVRIAGVATDITAQRHLERQLAEAQRMESIGRLAGGIAHDFNNLLTVILSSAHLAMARLPRELHGDLTAIGDAGERAARLTSQLLAFARRQQIRQALLDLNDLASRMEQLLRRAIGQNIELKTALEVGLGAVIADRSQLEQVLVNLAINARDAMPNGGFLTIETRNATVGSDEGGGGARVKPGDYVMLKVSDTGMGIPSDALPHVFEPFFTTKPQGQGTGLGLATCYGIVHQAGGVILVDTAIGRGTTFTIMLPRVPARAEPPERRPNVGDGRGTETVLFVEDDPAVRRIGVEILAQRHYRMLEASGGAQALEVASSYADPIHLLVTDVVMPRMSGTELASKLIGQRPDLRVLYTSGYTEESMVSQDSGEPKVAFLQKPYVADTLLDKVRELLDGS